MPLLFAYGIRDCQFDYLGVSGGGMGAGFLSKKIFWFLICKKKIKWLKRSTKNNTASKIVKKYIFWTHMMEMILFDISKCRWLLGGGGVSTYILSENRNYVYIIFCSNTIISSATRHHSNISLASSNNI